MKENVVYYWQNYLCRIPKVCYNEYISKGARGTLDTSQGRQIMKIVITTKQDAQKVGLPIGSIIDEKDAPQYLVDRQRNINKKEINELAWALETAHGCWIDYWSAADGWYEMQAETAEKLSNLSPERFDEVVFHMGLSDREKSYYALFKPDFFKTDWMEIYREFQQMKKEDLEEFEESEE